MPTQEPLTFSTEPRLCFLDVATTGLDPKRNEILEIAAIITDAAGETIARLDWRCKPSKPVPEDAARINGYTIAGWKDAVTPGHALRELVRVLQPYRGVTPVGHSIGFDLAFLERAAGDLPSSSLASQSTGTVMETRWATGRGAVLVASEELTPEPWIEVAEGTLLKVTRRPAPKLTFLAAL